MGWNECPTPQLWSCCSPALVVMAEHPMLLIYHIPTPQLIFFSSHVHPCANVPVFNPTRETVDDLVIAICFKKSMPVWKSILFSQTSGTFYYYDFFSRRTSVTGFQKNTKKLKDMQFQC